MRSLLLAFAKSSFSLPKLELSNEISLREEIPFLGADMEEEEEEEREKELSS